MSERLQKIIASSGATSRRKAEEWILAGRVQVNGKTILSLGTRADPRLDRITVDGKPLRPPGPPRVILLYKPRGYLCALSDPQGRPVVTSLLRKVRERLYPVGRLDFNSEGLLLLTNDGQLALRVAHPRYGVRKTYRVKVRGLLQPAEVRRIERGISVGGRRVAPVEVRPAGGRKNPWVLVTVAEGRNREVRRLFEAVGHPVVRLVRVSIGALRIGRMRPGEYRELGPEEILALVRPGKRSGGAVPLPASGRARRPRDESEE